MVVLWAFIVKFQSVWLCCGLLLYCSEVSVVVLWAFIVKFQSYCSEVSMVVLWAFIVKFQSVL